MKNAPYERLTLEAAKKLRWRTNQVLASRLVTLPAGTEVEIKHKINGWEVEAPRCKCCGVQVRITHVPHWKLDCLGPRDEGGKP